jgi:hypothetical protein
VRAPVAHSAHFLPRCLGKKELARTERLVKVELLIAISSITKDLQAFILDELWKPKK